MKKLLLSIFVCISNLVFSQSYGRLFIEEDESMDSVFLYLDNKLIDYRIKTLFDYFGVVEFDSLIPSEKYKLIYYISSENYSDDEYEFSQTNIEKKEAYFRILPDTSTTIYVTYYYSISYEPILDREEDSLRLNTYLKARERDFLDFKVATGNRNWKMNQTDNVNFIEISYCEVLIQNINHNCAYGYMGGVDLLYGIFNNSKTQLINQDISLKHQNYIQFNGKFEAFFRVQTREKTLENSYNLLALNLGAGYNLPILNRYTAFVSASEIYRKRFFHRFSDAYGFVGINIHAFTLRMEYHPFDLFNSNFYELSKFRVGVGFQILY